MPRLARDVPLPGRSQRAAALPPFLCLALDPARVKRGRTLLRVRTASWMAPAPGVPGLSLAEKRSPARGFTLNDAPLPHLVSTPLNHPPADTPLPPGCAITVGPWDIPRSCIWRQQDPDLRPRRQCLIRCGRKPNSRLASRTLRGFALCARSVWSRAAVSWSVRSAAITCLARTITDPGFVSTNPETRTDGFWGSGSGCRRAPVPTRRKIKWL